MALVDVELRAQAVYHGVYFRIFITGDILPAVPVRLLRMPQGFRVLEQGCAPGGPGHIEVEFVHVLYPGRPVLAHDLKLDPYVIQVFPVDGEKFVRRLAAGQEMDDERPAVLFQ